MEDSQPSGKTLRVIFAAPADDFDSLKESLLAFIQTSEQPLDMT
jgi:hypothetical protein